MASLPSSYSEITDDLLSKLAKEIASDYKDVDTILCEYGLDPGDFSKIKDLPRFQVFLQNARIGWNSLENVEDRLKKRAAATLEEALPEFYGRIHDPKEPLAAKAAVGELLRKISGVGTAPPANAGGERFSLTINMGSGAPKTIEGEVINAVDYSAAVK